MSDENIDLEDIIYGILLILIFAGVVLWAAGGIK